MLRIQPVDATYWLGVAAKAIFAVELRNNILEPYWNTKAIVVMVSQDA